MTTAGVGIVGVSSHSIAGRAGIRVGDIITKYAGHPIIELARLRATVDSEPRRAVVIQFLRGKRYLTATLQL